MHAHIASGIPLETAFPPVKAMRKCLFALKMNAFGKKKSDLLPIQEQSLLINENTFHSTHLINNTDSTMQS